ncbi:MAG: Hsp70 family protein, partial [Chloroflexota bacterium]
MIVGIDLGTTNSLVAVWKDGTPVLIPNSLGQPLTPSVVSVDDAGEVLVGAAALERQATRPRSTVAAFKRWMGTDRRVQLQDKSFRAEELSSLVLASLKADAEAYLGETAVEAVITVPAYFNDSQRQATRVAGQLAGLKVERLLNEPTAAALAYGLHEISNEKRFLIFDLGGGTFDVSILEYFDGVMEVHASAGDNYLGGEDFVDVLGELWLQRAKLKKTDLSPEALSLLRAQCERAKRQLSVRDSAELKLILKGEECSAAVERAEFEKASQALLARLGGPCERALRDAKLTVRDIDEVVLVGGATRMPMISRLVTQM